MRFAALAVAGFGVVCGSASPWDASLLPNPRTNPEACGKSGSSSICDPDALLGDTSRLEAAIRALEADHQYPDCGGYEMAVAVVREIVGGTEEDTEAFAKGVMDAWGVGKAACSNGLVLAIAVDDRHMHIATGRGASEHVPDRELAAVIERVKPLMRAARYGDAAEQCISDVARILTGESFAPSWLAEHGFVLLIFAGIVGKCMHSSYNTRRYNRCKRALTLIEQERAEAKASRYQVKSCAICLDNFAETFRLETRLLPCGHTFHARCVESWEGSRGSCPICRQPVDPAVLESTPSPSMPLQRSAASTGAHSGQHVDFHDDYRFRIRQARTLYPDFVSQSMVESWTVPGYHGPLVADTAFIRASPNYSSGSSSGGSSRGGGSSFGGGCSSGGGGAGGSW